MLDCAAPSPTPFHSLVSYPISPPHLLSPHHAPRPSHRFRRKCLIQRCQDPMEDSLSTMPKTLSKPKMPHPTKPDPRRRKSALIALAAALAPTSSSIRDPWRQHLLRSAISFSVPTARLQQRSMQGMANMLLLRRKETSAQSQCFTQLVRELLHHGK